MKELEQAKKLAKKTVKKSGKLLMDNLKKVKKMSFKARNDIVTEMDLKSEKILVDAISETFPNHTILSEEQGLTKHDSPYSWIIDPLDGTSNYFNGAAPFRVVLCFMIHQEPIFSCIYNPVKKELYFAEKGKGASMNGKPIYVSSNTQMSNSLILTHLSSRKKARLQTIHLLDKLFENTMQIRLFGSGSAALTYVATGKFDVFFNITTYPRDILPGALLIQEAGGKVTDINGGKITTESTSIIATNALVYDDIYKLIHAAKEKL